MAALAETFIFGLVNSLHCAGMCGPLAACTPGPRATTAAAYHLARVLAYAAAGATAGGLGQVLGSDALMAPSAWVALALAAGLVVLAAGGRGPFGHGALPIGVLRRLLGRSAAGSPAVRAATFGAVTPLLPCGLSWAVYASALLAGSWHGGSALVATFALGSLPALLLAQTPLAWLRRRLGPAQHDRLLRAVMVAAAIALAWRGAAALGGAASCCG